ncbi:hypothetical protein FQN54_003977 [Arachnomyces sp. PD_36]|nr:hypothetical protein FQN54_003977 [Arachnomyces sp. PD_36]
MPDESKTREFPAISSKLAAPTKKSLFERQKAEAEAKRIREQAETAAVYEDFVKSFDNDADTSPPQSAPGRSGPYGGRGSGPGAFAGGPSKRHFTSGNVRNSGPGSLGPPPPSLSRKRNYEGIQPPHRNRDSSQGIFAFENSPPGPMDAATAFQTSDDEDEKAVDKKEAERAAAKPTLHLSSLPPGTSPAVVKSLMPPVLVVDNVKMLPPSGQSGGERTTWSAIVTLAKETAAMDMDTAVSSLQNKYLGWGFYLSISRHLSSAAISSGMQMTTGLGSTTSLPFGARPIPQKPMGPMNRAPPPGPHRGGIAPPSSYGPGYGRGGPAHQVNVNPPSNLQELKLIHKTLENLLTYGPEFEALLMSRTDVQKQEKWAWLWDPRSPGGVWYRWKLWDILTDSQRHNRGRGRDRNLPISVFEGEASWAPPEKSLRFEHTTEMKEFVSDEEYDSSDDEDSDREDDRRRHDGAENSNADGTGYMNPLQKAKLVHLLARLPITNAKLRKGDVARVTAFAIDHAGEGADEVVDLIVSNVSNPLAYTGANPDCEQDKNSARLDNAPEKTTTEETKNPTTSDLPSKEKLDTSSAKLVALYIISDILSSSSTSGVRHAWRYRQLFESALKSRHVFEQLGRLEKDLGWGRLKAEKWKRSIGSVLHLWEGWCVFPQSSQEHFTQVFEKPPPTEKEKREERERLEAEKAAGMFGGKGKNRWKAVDEDTTSGAAAAGHDGDGKDLDGEKMDIDVDGAPIVDDDEDLDNIDGVPMEDSDLEDVDMDGKPLEEDSDGDGPAPEPQEPQPETKGGEAPSQANDKPADPGPPPRRRRPKAEDMFADSDSE